MLNLPAEKHSYGLRRLAAIESTRGSFASAADAIGRATGVGVAKRQVETLTLAAAADIDEFYTARRVQPCADDVLLVLPADGKGIVMRPDALRPATAKAAAIGTTKLATRLSKGEKRNRKGWARPGWSSISPTGRRPPVGGCCAARAWNWARKGCRSPRSPQSCGRTTFTYRWD